MKEDQVKALLKKSALNTSESFTGNLMLRIEAKSAMQMKPAFPSINRVIIIIVPIVMLLSSMLFLIDFSALSVIKLDGNADRTKLFVLFLLSVLVGVNYLLKMQHASKNLISQKL